MMRTANDIPRKDDALRRAMQRRKALRPATALSEGLEDRVMDRIAHHVRKARLVRSWAIRIASAAAIAIGFFFAKTMTQEKHVEKPSTVAKAESGMSKITDTKTDGLPVQKAEVTQTQRHRPPSAPRRRHKQQERPVQKAEVVQASPHRLSPASRRQHKRPDIGFAFVHRDSAIRTTTMALAAPSVQQEPAPSVAEEATLTQTRQDVCIDCEMAAMTSELTAMFNEFENQ